MAKAVWTTENIGDQSGKTIIVTGSNSGIGKETVKQLAAKGAKVIMAVRNLEKGRQAMTDIKQEVVNADIEVRQLDLSDLKSVRAFSDTIHRDMTSLDMLINNAGIMMCPKASTADGFDIQVGTNHFGHFALTALLFPLLCAAKHSRLVVVSSIAHKMAKINLDDVNWTTRKYDKNKAYFESKLANTLFAYEYVKRFSSQPNAPRLTLGHPGWTSTGLQQHVSYLPLLNKFFAQAPKDGALPTLRAATDETAVNGDFFGPANFFELRGHPVHVSASSESKNQADGERLWSISEDLTDVSFAMPTPTQVAS